MKNISHGEPTDWAKFGETFAGSAIGRFSIVTLFESMNALEKYLQNEKYAQTFIQHLTETGSNYTWH